MTERILSQEEVNALLKGVQDGKIRTQPSAAPTPVVRAYDFSARDPISPEGMSVLHFAHARFARLFQTALSSIVRKEIQVQPMPAHVISFDEFVKDIPPPVCLNLVKMEPLNDPAFVLLKSETLYTLLELLFGGSGRGAAKTAVTEFTPIEQRVIRRIVGMVLDEFLKAWVPFYSFQASLIRSETNPQFTKIMSAGDQVIRISFMLQIEDTSREILLALPCRAMEPVFEKWVGGSSRAREVDSEWAVGWRSSIADCPVSVTAELGATALTVREFTRLAVGDVIVLEKKVSDDLEMKVEGRPKFRGHPGVYRGKPVFQITSLIHEARRD